MQAFKDNHPKFLRRGSIRVVVVFRAFSLTEVVICAAILAILGGIAAPKLADANSRARVVSASAAAASVIERASVMAECSGASRIVRFRNGSGTIELTRRDGSDAERFDLAGEPWRTVLTSVDFGGDQEIVFDGFGESDSSGALAVQSAGYSCRVEWNPTTRKCVVHGLQHTGTAIP